MRGKCCSGCTIHTHLKCSCVRAGLWFSSEACSVWGWVGIGYYQSDPHQHEANRGDSLLTKMMKHPVQIKTGEESFEPQVVGGKDGSIFRVGLMSSLKSIFPHPAVSLSAMRRSINSLSILDCEDATVQVKI